MFIFLKKSEGFIVMALPFLSLFVAASLGLGAVIKTAKHEMRRAHECQSSAIELQSIFAELAEKLEAMNPLAKSLQAQEKVARLALAAAELWPCQ